MESINDKGGGAHLDQSTIREWLAVSREMNCVHELFIKNSSWQIMNINQHLAEWLAVSREMNCVHELFIKNSSWQIMNINQHLMN